MEDKFLRFADSIRLEDLDEQEFRALFRLNLLGRFVVDNSTKKGFRDKLMEGLTDAQRTGPVGRLLRAAVMTLNEVGELAEFWEAFRAGKLDESCDKGAKMQALGLPVLTNAEEEIADTLIRALDRAEAHGIDVDKAVWAKMRLNMSRPHLHGGKVA